MKKTFEIKKVFSLAWADYKKNWLIATGALIPIFVLDLLSSNFGLHSKYPSSPMMYQNSGPAMPEMEGSLILTIVFWFIGIYLTMGLIKLFLNMADGKKADFSDLFSGPKDIKHYFLYLGTYILMSLAVIIPAIIVAAITFWFAGPQSILITPLLLFILFLIIGTLVQFAGIFSIENRYHFFNAIAKSYEIAKDNISKLVGTLILIALLNFIGAIPLLLGLLITVPLSLLVYVHIYRSIDPEVIVSNNIEEAADMDNMEDNTEEEKDEVEEKEEEGEKEK